MRRYLGLLLVLACAVPALAQSAPVSLQGRLAGVPDGEREITINIWDTETGGTLIESDTVAATVAGGVFTAVAEFEAGDAFGGAVRYWSVSIDGAEVGPRRLLTYAPIAASVGGDFWSTGDTLRAAEPLVITTQPAGWLTPGVRFPEPGVNPNADGFRFYQIRIDGGGTDWWVFDKTDGNARTPDGAIAFANTGDDGETEYAMVIQGNGRIGVGTDDPRSLFHVKGSLRSQVLVIDGGSDLAEPFPAAPGAIQPKPGMVLSIDPQTPGALRVSTEAYDTKVAGVYSGGNGLPTGMLMGKDGCELTTNGEDRLPLAMTGRVWVYADDSGGEIRPGDRLTTSGANPGFAARVANASHADGAVIGKAMTEIDETTGMVLVLVNLQ